MSSNCNQESGTINIANLPKASEIKPGNHLIVELDKTHILDFEDFVISLDNTSFKPRFLELEAETTHLGTLSSGWESTYTTVLANSAIWNQFDTNKFNVKCWDATCSVVETNSANWNATWTWGNHANTGYVKTETDPTVPSFVKSITEDDIARWNLGGSFLDLADAPDSYLGQGTKFVAVKSTNDGLEFVNACEADAPDTSSVGGGGFFSGVKIFVENKNVSWTVPSDTTRIWIKAWGGGGAGGAGGNQDYSGDDDTGTAGGYVEGIYDVTPGTILQIRAGMGGAWSYWNYSSNYEEGRSTVNGGDIALQARAGQPARWSRSGEEGWQPGPDDPSFGGDIILDPGRNIPMSPKAVGGQPGLGGTGFKARIRKGEAIFGGDGSGGIDGGGAGFPGGGGSQGSTSKFKGKYDTGGNGCVIIYYGAAGGGGVSSSSSGGCCDCGKTFSSDFVAADHNGTELENGAELIFTHNLGTTDALATIFIADDAAGTNAQMVEYALDGNYSTGAHVNYITASTAKIYLGHQGWIKTPCDGGNNCLQSWSSKYIKVILSTSSGASETSSAGQVFVTAQGEFITPTFHTADNGNRPVEGIFGTVTLPLPPGKTWKHVKLVYDANYLGLSNQEQWFTKIKDENNIEFPNWVKTGPTINGPDGNGGNNCGGSGQASCYGMVGHTSSGAEGSWIHMFEGVPTNHTADANLVLKVSGWNWRHTDTDLGKSSFYAVGIAG